MPRINLSKVAPILVWAVSFFFEDGAYADQRLTVPDFSQSAIIGYQSGLRPFRKGGIRLESEIVGDKKIIHNYGHGGSGISLSWGSASISLEILENISHGSTESEIAILGSGVIGLTTAHLLLDKGYKVHVYATDFPPNTTSNVAPAVWSPFNLGDVDFNNEIFWKIYKFSLQKYRRLAFADNPEFKGVRYVNAYSFKPDTTKYEDIYVKKLPIRVFFTDKTLMIGTVSQKLVIDTSIYIEELYQKAKEKGGIFTPFTLHTLEDIKKIEEEIVFNCLGLGSREVFQDTYLRGTRGQLIYLTPSKEANYILSGPDNIYFIPLSDKIAMGGSYEINENANKYDKEVVDNILKNASNFFLISSE